MELCLPFVEFRQQVEEYFTYKKQLLIEHLPEKEKNYFYRLNGIEDRAFENHVILDYIGSRSPWEERDSLFFEYLDTELLDFKNMEKYLDAGRLRSFYSKKGVEYFMKKKYGDELDSIREEKEFYVFRDEIVSEHFDQPLRSILIYSDLKYYPIEYDYAPDSLNFRSPREMLSRYKKDLSEEAYTNLSETLEQYESKKNGFSEGASVPDFLLRNKSNQAYELKPAEFDKFVLIDVWASWCCPCIQKFPEVRKLEQEYSDQLEVISISIDNKFDQYKKGIDELEVPGRLQLYAEDGFTSDFAKHFQVLAISRYILISRKGKIVDANVDLAEIGGIVSGESGN